MPDSDPVAELEEILVARGMLRQDIPAFIERYAKRPVLEAAQELQQRGIRYQIAYQALEKLQEPENLRESALDSPLNLSAGKWIFLSMAFIGAGLWTLKHGAFAATFGPWLFLSLFALGAVFSLCAIPKWIG